MSLGENQKLVVPIFTQRILSITFRIVRLLLLSSSTVTVVPVLITNSYIENDHEDYRTYHSIAFVSRRYRY